MSKLLLFLFLFITNLTFSQVDLTNGLAAYYPFNGNANDESGNGNNAIFNNATLTTDRLGNPNSAYYFNGVDNYIQIPNASSLNPSNQISISVMIKPMGFYYGPCHGNRIIMKGDADYLTGNYLLTYDDNFFSGGQNCSTNLPDTLHETFYAMSTGTSLNNPPFVQKDTWHRLVYTYDGSNAKLYVDCNLVFNNTVAGLTFSNQYDLFLGKMNHPQFPYWFNGVMDEVRIYNRALNEQEINALCTISVEASFTAPDTVCVNTPVNIQNTSQGASNYFWNFCTANINEPPTGTNLGNVGGSLSAPVYIDYVFTNGNYYGFVTNNFPGGLLRLDFGNSLLNTPTITNLGNIGGAIADNTEGIQIANDNGNWYVLIVGGDPSFGSIASLTTVSLGVNIANNTPTATNWGNIGNLAYPHDLYVFKDNGHWYGLTSNYSNSTITLFDLTTSLSNTPSASNLGNIGNLSGPTGIQAINDNGNWHVFITNATSSTLSRLDFGSSLLNIPTGVNLGNLNNTFITCWDIFTLKYCGNDEAFVINANGTNDIVKLDFGNSLLNTPAAVSLGNQGNLNFPHCISKLFRVGADVFTFITNVNSNSITLLKFAGCTNANIPNSTAQNPPPITYNAPGVYNINLTVDDGLPTQSSYCKQIVVTSIDSLAIKDSATSCNSFDFKGDASTTSAVSSWQWDFGDGGTANTQNTSHVYTNAGTYIVKLVVTNATGCKDSVSLPENVVSICDNPVAASFIAPDTVCVNTPVQVTNTSTNATNYYWNFCVADVSQPPTGTNLGNVGGALSFPVFMDYVFYNNNYYGFLINHNPGSLIRLDFGNSLLNAPMATDLGNFGGIIPPGRGAEAIQLVYNEGRWYAIIVGGYAPTGSTPRILKIDFGSDLTNLTPAATDWGNLGNMLQPIDLHVFKEGNNWYGFTVNAENNTITRFNFTNSFSNVPTAVNLGNLGNLAYPTGIYAIDDNGFWRVFVVNGGDNTRSSGTYSLTRLDFGNSLLNSPTAINLGNPGNLLQHPRDITIMKMCDQIIGFAVNGHFNNSNIIQLNFNNNLSATPTLTSLGVIGNSSFPHSISKLFRVNSDIYAFITNVDNNTITRLKFAGCTGSNVLNSSLQNPPPVIYNAPGVYNINLSVDDGLPTQTTYCKQVVVLDSSNGDFGYQIDICNPLTVQFNGIGSAQNPYWAFGDGATSLGNLNPVHTYPAAGNYTMKYSVSNGLCTDTVFKTISLGIIADNIIITPDTTICFGSTKQLLTQPALSFCWSPATYLDDPNSPNPTTSTPQNITYYYTAEVTGTNVITNGDFSQGNTGFTSEYNYANPNITEGEYFVEASPQGWNNALSNCGDHTTGTGNMLLVNGSPTPDVRVWTQTVAVVPNTNYAFSTWLQALWPPNPAQLQFSINGQDMGTLITASLPTCTWSQFYTTWNSGNLTSATISIVNKNTEIQGNDFALDDISFAPVFIKRDSVIITVEKPVVKTNDDTTVCPGSFIQFNTTGAFAYAWVPTAGLSGSGIANPIAAISNPVSYIVTGTTVNGCTATDTVAISTFAKPIITTTSDTGICVNTSIQLFASGGTSYSWSPVSTLTDPGIANPVATPANTTTYYVTVANALGCLNTDSIKVSVNSLPVITKSSDTAICANTSIQLSVSGGTTYLWTPTSTLNNPGIANPVATPVNATTYYVTVTNGSGCSAGDSIKVAVNSSPVITKSNDTTVCAGNSVQLSVSGGTTYSWMPASSLNNPGIANPVATPAGTTTYFVIVKNATGCSTNDSIKVSINALPTIAISNDTSVCNNTQVQLFANGGSIYSWTPTSTLSSSSINNPVATPSSTTTYHVTVTNSSGCSGNDSVKITTSPIPVISKSNDTSICSNTTAQLFASGGLTYIWAPSSGLSNPNIPNPVASPVTPTTYLVTVVNNPGCFKKDSVKVSIYPPSAITTSNDSVVCGNTPTQIFASGGSSYTWFPATSLSNSNISNPVASPSSTTTYHVSITDANSCKYGDSVTLTIKPLPVFSTSPGESICAGNSSQLSASGGDSYFWQPANFLSNQNINNPIATPDVTTLYTVQIKESTCNYSATLSTQINVMPLPVVKASKSNDIDCSYGFSQLKASGANQYTWQPFSTLNNVTIANPIATPLVNTLYTVTGVGNNGCENSDTVTVLVEFNNKNALYLMPNSFTPNGDGVNDCYGLKYWGNIIDLDFSIYNRFGEQVFHTTKPGSCWNGKYKGEPQNIGAFVYTVKAKTYCGIINRKGTFVLLR